MHKITIKNCNNIKNANITISEGQLNIKYGQNGTGKSSISEAIFAKATDDINRLVKMKPYCANDDETPSVEGLDFKKVRVFDEKYMDKYLFKGDSFFDDSFQVFLRSQECDDLVSQINKLLSTLQGMFMNNSDLQNLRLFLPTFFSTVKCNNDGSVAKRGGVNEFVKGNGCGFEKYPELDTYKIFYANREMAKVSKWAKWRNDGINEILDNTCPFCASLLDAKIENQNFVISNVLKSSALSTANAILEYMKKAVDNQYIDDNARLFFEQYIGNPNKSDELYSELQKITTETSYLHSKIEKICFFRPLNVTREQLNHIEDSLEEMRIDSRQISQYYSTEFILEIVNSISQKIDELKSNVGRLKGLFLQYDQKLSKLIENREQDIDDFFALAGFPYKFVLEKDGENKAKALLRPIERQDINVSEPKERLSWGEKNSFSLVMFMFEAISDNADLIVLDDPISSFDENKKFAIIRRLFDNQKISFRDKTILMLTHDMQPLIDYVHGNFFGKYGLTTHVNACLIQNNNGTIGEQEIKKSDLLNVIQLTQEIAKDDTASLPVRVVNLRKFIEISDPYTYNLIAYDVLSNIIHGRVEPVDKEKNKLSEVDVSNGMSEITKYISGYDYVSLCNEVSDGKLIDIIKTGGLYDKIISIRFLLERKEGLLLKLKRECPAACKFVNETNHIENDYVFQLDPRKYFSVPQYILLQLEEFVCKNYAI